MSERPVECSQCKRPAKVVYKEILEDGTACTEMCSDCPILQAKLHGEKDSKGAGQMCCKTCKTPLESIQMGQPLGCADCYETFGEWMMGDLISTGALPPQLQKKISTQRLQTFHIGKSPRPPSDATLASRLLALNEALTDALKRENFEQAAWLRDQIKTLTKP